MGPGSALARSLVRDDGVYFFRHMLNFARSAVMKGLRGHARRRRRVLLRRRFLGAMNQSKMADGAKHAVVGFFGNSAKQRGAGLVLFNQRQHAVAGGAYVIHD